LTERSFQGSKFSLRNDQNSRSQGEALFQQAAVCSCFLKKWLPTTPWVDAIQQQNTISKKYSDNIISQSITFQSLINLSWLL
jgi:hypothetical protein